MRVGESASGSSQSARDAWVDTIRAAIRAQIAAEELNIYALTKRLKNRVGARTIYDFMAAHAEINVGALAEILDALDLEISIAPRRGTGYQVKAKWVGADKQALKELYTAFYNGRNRSAFRGMLATITRTKRNIAPLPPHPPRAKPLRKRKPKLHRG
jgi:hypothetical protein